MGRESHSHHHHHHHHHKHKSDHSVKEVVTKVNEESQPNNEMYYTYMIFIVERMKTYKLKIQMKFSCNITNSVLLYRKVKRILLDFRKQDENALDDLKTQFNLLDNGYSVDLNKISNSLLQGTLHVVFSLLHLPETNHGYFWNEEDYNGMTISSLFDDCLTNDIQTLEQLLNTSEQQNKRDNNDNNEIDLDDLESESEEELNYGPSLPQPSFTKEVVENGKHLVGPAIPDGKFLHSFDLIIRDSSNDI